MRFRGRHPLSLRTRVSLIVAATIAILLVGATIIRAVEERRTFMTEQRETGFFMARALANLIMHEGGPDRLERVRDAAAMFGRTPGVVDVLIVDSTFTIIADAHPRDIGLTYRRADVAKAIREGREATEVKRHNGRDVLDVVVPLRVGERITGALEIGLDLGPAQARIRTFIWRGVLLSVLVALVATIVLLRLLSYQVVDRIILLATRAGQLQAGDFTVEFPDGRPDEIGHLSRTLISTRDSLKELSVLWRDQQPLTGLPGNRAIRRELERRLEAGIPFVALWADLVRFKAFNDRYGFVRGDELIRFIGHVLEEALEACGGPDDFLGHLGGDDFVLAVSPERDHAIAQEAIRRYETGLSRFYDEADYRRGYIGVVDRRRATLRVPLAGLTIVGVTASAGSIRSPLELGEVASEMKAYAKSRPGSKYVKDRRALRVRRSPAADGRNRIIGPRTERRGKTHANQ